MSSRKAPRKKGGKKKKVTINKNMTPYSVSLFCLGVLVTITVFFICYQYKSLTQSLLQISNASTPKAIEDIENDTFTLHNNNFQDKPVRFEFYSSLPKMKVAVEEPKVHDNGKSIALKPKPLQKPHPKPHISNAKELEKDVLRHIKHKETR